jgi:hypothetical protein
MLREDEVIGCELKRSKEIRRDDCRHVMQIHLVELRLLRHLVEELNDEHKDIPIDCWESGANLFQFGASFI